MKKYEIRNIVITGNYNIGPDGPEPVWGWKDYVDKLEDILIQNNGSLPNINNLSNMSNLRSKFIGLQNLKVTGAELSSATSNNKYIEWLEQQVVLLSNNISTKEIKNLLSQFRDEKMPNWDTPYYYNAEAWSVMMEFIKWLEIKK